MRQDNIFFKRQGNITHLRVKTRIDGNFMIIKIIYKKYIIYVNQKLFYSNTL